MRYSTCTSKRRSLEHQNVVLYTSSQLFNVKQQVAWSSASDTSERYSERT